MSKDKERKAKSGNMTGLEIAVIGMAVRFPGAKDIEEFWNNLKNGVEAIWYFSDEELEASGIEPGLIHDSNYIKTKGALDDIEGFDASFFDYFDGEALYLDPQVRILHECTWHALEDSGYDPWTYKGLIGLYAGANPNLYWNALIRISSRYAGDTEQFASEQLSDRDYLCTRISYKLNLRGPAVFIQTACSTSLTAIHVACRALLTGECDMALAGGVTVSMPNKKGYIYQEGMIHSRDGHCRAFDANASGLVPGDGAGIVVLKSFKKAAAEGDRILALVKGSSINNDGIRKVGFTAPSVEGQAEVIRAALRIARVEPESISYIETHGTGTLLGDPIEIESLKLAFDTFDTGKKNRCPIGSVKTNVGHLDIAAGVAGFVKVILSIQHQLIPPSLNFTQPNPKIDFENSPFYVNTRLLEWKNHEYPLRAGVSSFGVGGTNAHVVLEEAPEGTRVLAPLRQYQLILLSAKTQSALDKMTENLAEYFKKNFLNRDNHKNPTNPGPTLADAAYTLQVGRRAFPHRRMVVGSTVEEVMHSLHFPDAPPARTGLLKKYKPPVVLMFPGQGAQYVNMGIDLYRDEPLFREEIDRCFEILEPLLDHNLKEILYPGDPGRGGSPGPPQDGVGSPGQGDHHDGCVEIPLIGSPGRGINQTRVAQPALFIFQYALARLLIKWGIEPWAMIGHSIGEYVCACLSGVLSLEDALKLVVYRGRFMQEMPPGAMVSAALSEEQVKPLLNEELSLAALNGISPPRCVISGPTGAIDTFVDRMHQLGHQVRRLHTSHAFHSNMMTPVIEKFEKEARQVTLNPPQIPFISNVSGTWISEESAKDPGYWAGHLRETVRFADGIEELKKKQHVVFIEVGPGNTLTTLVKNLNPKGKTESVINLVRHPRENEGDTAYLLQGIGQLWLSGVNIDWSAFHYGEKRNRISLPLYPFEHRPYRIEGNPLAILSGSASLPLSGPTTPVSQKKADMNNWFYIPSWKCSVPPSDAIHAGAISFPGLLFLDDCGMGERLARQLKGKGHEIFTVKKGTAFSCLNEGEYTIEPGAPGDYRRLINELAEIGKFPVKILHLWNITGAPEAGDFLQQLDCMENSAFYSLIYLARAIGKIDIAGIDDYVQLMVVSNGMQPVTGGEILHPAKALITGPCRVIELEYSHIDCRSIDVMLPEPGTAAEQLLLDQLSAEFISPAVDRDKVMAYRDGYRWVQCFEPLRLGKNRDPQARLRQEGVYLITGGLGGIGLTLAKYLAAGVKGKLILTGVSAFPARDRWEQWLEAHGPDDKISIRIRKVQELERLGAEVLVLSADVSDMEQMQEVIRQANQRFGPLNGVIHAAGIADGGVIPLRNQELSRRVLAPKVRGTLVLERVLEQHSLDFFVLCSSLASTAAEIGEVAYVAANAFLDAYAFYRTTKDNTFTVSINWDGWQEVGMAVESAKKLAQNLDIPGYQAIVPDENALLPSEGIEVFKRILESQFSQVLVSTQDLTHRDKEKKQLTLPGAGTAEIHHRGEEKPDREKYVSTSRLEETHWLFKEHHIMGQAVLPGTAYLELAAAAFEKYTGNNTMEIREIYFLAPMIAKENETVKIQTILEKNGDVFEFSISSCTTIEKNEPEQGDWQENARGKIASPGQWQENNYPGESLQGEELKEMPVKEESYEQFGPHWHNLKQIKLASSHGIARLELADPYHNELNRYRLHPALLDCATAFLTDYIEGDFLPFTYKNVKIKYPLPGKLISKARYAGDWQSPGEFVNLAVTITDERGRVCVDIEAYTLRNMDKLNMMRMTDGEIGSSPGDDKEKFCLEVPSPGILESLRFTRGRRQEPGPGEVEIKVRTVGLNFKDVLLALNLSANREELEELGSECSGEIVALGRGVTHFKPGDEVIAVGAGCFSSFVITPASSVVSKPAHIGWEEAATLLGPFTTAYYSLVQLGRLAPGERVLIHTAAGGVGMAAVQIAQWVGTELFVTAGNKKKQEFLRSLGINRVMDSRSLAFGDQVMQMTKGKGVDVVLNTLGGGDFMVTGLSILAPYGRFLELGKRDILENRPLNLGVFEKNLGFFSVSVGPELPKYNALVEELVPRFNTGVFKPLPHRVFPGSNIVGAFQYMAQAKHIGKIVISFSDAAGIDVFKQKKESISPLPHTISAAGNDVPTGENDVENQLLMMCRKLLKNYQLGIHDDFFEIGADSLTLVQLYSRINQRYPNRLILQNLFNNRTIHQLANLVAGTDGLVPGKEKKRKRVEF
ncbi:MAG: SDR family NAD(P)-dependent oxidoreductase [Candidatus Aminicenantes bacterium]|jgi:acyl transferase domain-containing protein